MGYKSGEMLGGNRIFAPQPHTNSIEVKFSTQHSDPFYPDMRGVWEKLDNVSMFLTEAQVERVVEVDSRRRSVWE